MLKATTVPVSCSSRYDHVADTRTSEASLAAGHVPIMGLNFASAVTTQQLPEGLVE